MKEHLGSYEQIIKKTTHSSTFIEEQQPVWSTKIGILA